MNYKKMSTEELVRELSRWTPNPEQSLPVQFMYHEQQMKIMSNLTAYQVQNIQVYLAKSIDQQKKLQDQEKESDVFGGVIGVIMFLVIWALLGNLAN